MGKADVLLSVSRLVAAFRKEDMSDEAVNVYVDALKQVDPDLLAVGIERIISTKRFFPTVAELRESVARAAGKAPAISAETQAIIRQADVSEPVLRRDGSFAYTERYWRWPENLNHATRMAIEEALAKVGEPQDESGKPIFGWDKAFKEVYESVVEEMMATMDFSVLRLPPATDGQKQLGSK